MKMIPFLIGFGFILFIIGNGYELETAAGETDIKYSLAPDQTTSAKPPGDSFPLSKDPNGKKVYKYSGTATSSKSGREWPFTLTVEGPEKDGSISGQIEWPSLNSINKIEGSKTATGITFAETEYIEQGGAFLNCRYYLDFKGTSLEGTWDGCNDDYGDFSATLEAEPEIDLQARTEYIIENRQWPGVLILVSSWQHGDPNDVTVPDVPVYITVFEEGSVTPYSYKDNVKTNEYGYLFGKWVFEESEKDKSWVIYFSTKPGEPGAEAIATTVSSHIPDDLSHFTPESEIYEAYPAYTNNIVNIIKRIP